jgi:urease subunit alpha
VLGIVKGDIGIKDGKIVASARPAIRHHGWRASEADLRRLTTVRDAEGLIATPGGIDVHVHFDSAQLCEHAIAPG